MTLSDDDLQEYMQIWREEFGESISLEDARHSASMLLELFVVLLEPLPDSRERSLHDHRT